MSARILWTGDNGRLTCDAARRLLNGYEYRESWREESRTITVPIGSTLAECRRIARQHGLCLAEDERRGMTISDDYTTFAIGADGEPVQL